MAKIAIIGLSGGSIFMKVNSFPEKGETKVAEDLYFEPGGKGFNQAVACSRSGLKCYFLSAIGDDHYGNECKKVLMNENVDFTLVQKNDNTSLATIITDDEGENKVIVSHGAKLHLDDLKIFSSRIKQADVLLLQLEVPINIIKKAIKIAKENNKFVILNPAPFQKIDKEIIECVDLFTPNEGEAKMLFDLYPKEIFKNIVITMGDKGAILYSDNKETIIPPYKVKAVDTTGAGDTFNAALAVRIAEGASLIEACKFASVAAAFSVIKPYVINALPKLEDVEKAYEKNINNSI